MAVISLGNSSVGCALWSGGGFAFRKRVPLPELEGAGLFAELGDLPRPEVVAVASAVPDAEAALDSLLERELGLSPRYLGRDLAVPLKLDVDEPEKAGADRLAAALAAHRGWGAAAVVDFGTAVTVDAVTAGGEFLGGAIMPGPELSARALSAGTAGVKVPAPAAAVSPPGKSTAAAVAAALTHGLAGAVDRLVEETTAALGGKAAAVATGGGAALLAPLCRTKFKILPDLVLEGLVIAVQESE